MPDIVLSYASEDRPTAKALADAFHDRGFSVFWDRKIPVGRSFEEVIEQAIDESRCVVVIWSRNAAASEWVRNEAEEGKRRKILQPVLIDDAKLPLSFRHLQAANLSDWTPAKAHLELDGLIEAIQRTLGASGPREPAEPDTETDHLEEVPPPGKVGGNRPVVAGRQRKIVLSIVGAVAAVGIFAIAAANCQGNSRPYDAIAPAEEATAPATEAKPDKVPEAPAAVSAD
jgi:hypothetical protein